MKIWENRAGLKSEKSFQAYLFTIAFNAIKKQFNKKMKAEKYRYDIFESLTGDVPSLESRLDFEKLLEKLDRIIDELPERRKKIFLMRKKEGKSVNDIANELGVSPKTVENQITEAMHALKKAFSSDDLSSLLFYILFVS
jgi:RNA polymerase sigma-70 factor (ECF subfamily)